MPARSQAALYREIALDLSWSERQLPQSERTKHVHGLHPYLGKFVPQLAEAFLVRCFDGRGCVLDPFMGSGTTLVESAALGMDAVGVDISAFNCLLVRVKTADASPAAIELALRATLERAAHIDGAGQEATPWLERWYAPRALADLLAYRAAMRELDGPAADAAAIVLTRAARSARLTTHFDLDFPARPVHEPYWCHKHRRTCSPVPEAAKFLRRYTEDAAARLRAFAAVRGGGRVAVVHGDVRTGLELPLRADGILTSPPYPGLIDYHEQHRYAYELLGLADRRAEEIGAAAQGRSRRAQRAYVDSMAQALGAASDGLPPGSPVVIVVNDRHDLYPAILDGAALRLEERITRHVNRRTGRRAGEYYEDVLVCRTG
jgi:hypothetical protein